MMSVRNLRYPTALVLRGLARACEPASTAQRCLQPRTRASQHRLASVTTYTLPSNKRWHSAPSERSRQYEFDDIKTLSGSPAEDKIIIDVREPAEYEAGYIPGAINIPVKSQPDAIFLPEEEFEDRFGFSKPGQEKEIIFYCRSGVRSSAAAQLAQQQGYKNISEYRGSWLDWEKNGGPVAKP